MILAMTTIVALTDGTELFTSWRPLTRWLAVAALVLHAPIRVTGTTVPGGGGMGVRVVVPARSVLVLSSAPEGA